MNNETIKNNLATVDIVIPVKKPGNRFKEVVERLRKQTIQVNKIYILNLVKNVNYDNIEKADGIVNFSYENGNVCFNGIQSKDGDIMNFTNDGSCADVEVVYCSEKEISKNGLCQKVLQVSNADIIIYMSKDALPMNRYMVYNIIDVFKNEKVKASVGRLMPSRKLSYIEKNELKLSRMSDSGVVEVDSVGLMPVSALWSFNTCTAYRRETLENFVSKNKEISMWNEDLVIFQYITYTGGSVAFSDAEVTCYKKITADYVFTRSYEIEKVTECTVALNKPGKKRILRTSFKKLLTRGRGYLIGELMSYVFIILGGILTARILPKGCAENIFRRVKM